MKKDITKAKTRTGITKFIRLRGFVSFLSLILIIALFVCVFAESLIRISIKSTLETAFGAEVNVTAVELNYSPLALTVKGLQVTDAENPDFNVFSFQTAKAGFDGWQYLLGKTIIEDLSVEELMFATKRESIGEVFTNKERDHREDDTSGDSDSMLPAMNLSLPDVNSLLNNKDLLTLKASQQLAESYEQEKVKWSAIQASLPNKAKLESYEQRVKALGKMRIKSLEDLNQVKAKFEQLKAEFKQDQQQVELAKNEVIRAKNRLEQGVTNLKDAPGKDWQRIEKKYQLDNISNDDFAHILFGDKARKYYQTAENVYKKIAPSIKQYNDKKIEHKEEVPQRYKPTGRFVYFTDDSTLPPFLIKQANISVISLGEQQLESHFEIRIEELTAQHYFRGKASKASVEITMAKKGIVTANIEFFIDELEAFSASGDWQAEDLQVNDIEISENKDLSLSLEQGALSGNGDFSVQKDQSIGGKHRVTLDKVNYKGEANSKFALMLLDTFNELDTLTMALSMSGTINEPEFSIQSSLNTAIKGAFKTQIDKQLGSFKQKVIKGLNDKVAQSLKLNEADSQNFVEIEALITDTDNALENLKKSDVVKQQKAKLKDKAADKIKDKLKGLFGN